MRKQEEVNIGSNLGVIIQTTEAVRKQSCQAALIYIGSCARALHDPHDIWKGIEEEALRISADPMTHSKKISYREKGKNC